MCEAEKPGKHRQYLAPVEREREREGERERERERHRDRDRERERERERERKRERERHIYPLYSSIDKLCILINVQYKY